MILHLLLNACGLLGNICFGIGCVPSAYKVWRAGKNTELPVNFAWILWTACLSFYIYLIGTYGWSWFTGPLGLVETLAYSVVLFYNYFPRVWKPSGKFPDDLPFDMNAPSLSWNREENK